MDLVKCLLYGLFVLLNAVDYLQSKRLVKEEEMNPLVRWLWGNRWVVKLIGVSFVIGLLEMLDGLLPPILANLFMTGVVVWNEVNEHLLQKSLGKSESAKSAKDRLKVREVR